MMKKRIAQSEMIPQYRMLKLKLKLPNTAWKKAQYGNAVNPHVPLLWQVKTYLLLLI